MPLLRMIILLRLPLVIGTVVFVVLVKIVPDGKGRAHGALRPGIVGRTCSETPYWQCPDRHFVADVKSDNAAIRHRKTCSALRIPVKGAPVLPDHPARR